MWWPFKKTEARQEIIDASAVFARAYQNGNAYGGTPVELLAVLESPDAAGELRREARYLARSCPFLGSYLRVMARGVLPTDMPPLGVSEGTAAWWQRYWRGPVGVAGATGLDFEAMALKQLIIDGEFFVSHRRDGMFEVVAADAVESLATGGDDAAPWPISWKIRGMTVAHGDAHQVANRDDPGTVRGRSILARALPAARAVVVIGANAGQGSSVMSRFVGILEAAGAAGLAMTAAGSPLLGSTGLDADTRVSGDPAETARRQFPAGALPTLPTGSKLVGPEYGLPERAAKQVEELKTEIAAALGLSRYALDGDTANANFSSLRHGHRRDEDSFAAWTAWWCRTFRLPIWRRAVVAAVAAGELEAAAIRETPEWPSPYLTAPLPEADAKAVGLLNEQGLIDLDKERLRRGVRRRPDMGDAA